MCLLFVINFISVGTRVLQIIVQYHAVYFIAQIVPVLATGNYSRLDSLSL